MEPYRRIFWKRKNTILMVLVGILVGYLGRACQDTTSINMKLAEPNIPYNNISGNWVVVKFAGQTNGSAGIAFPDTNRIPPIDIIFQTGIFLRDEQAVKNFANIVEKNGGSCFIVKQEDFQRMMIDNTLFEGF